MWAELFIQGNGSLHTINYRIFIKVEGKDKLLATMWDSFCKHVGRKKTKKKLGLMWKKGLVLFQSL